MYGSENLRFIGGDFTRYNNNKPINNIYSRWTMHSIDEIAEDRTLKWVSAALLKGGRFLVEARSINDDLYGQGELVGEDSYVTDHFRRFMNKNKFIQKLIDLDFKIIFSVESKGLAVYKNDDPKVIRIVAEKK